MFSLKDKVALITGGANGIGKAVAETFHKAGAKIVIWDLDVEGQKTADSLNGKFYKVNTSDREGLEKATQKVLSDFGRIDILVNNAGILRDSSFLKMTDDLWDSVINVNLTGVYNCAKAIVPYMKTPKIWENNKCFFYCWCLWKFWTNKLLGCQSRCNWFYKKSC